MESPCVRFDDLSPGGSGSFGLLEPVDTIVARRLDDVADAIEQAEAAAEGGLWVAGYVSYEAAPAFNPILTVRPPGLHDRMRELPLARFQTFRRRIPLDEIDSVHFPAGEYNVSGWTADASPEDYRDHLATIGRAIMAGEVAQLKHTFRLHAAFSGDPTALYRDLLLSQRGPHAACVDTGRFRLVSASPQGFFRRTGNTITVRPVLATAGRGRWLDEDLHLAALLRSEVESDYTNRLIVKEIEAEIAEVGDPIAQPETDRYTVEKLETVWQLTAEVEAVLHPATRLVDIFTALFPLATVTGVPKVEAMELVAATEQTPRGAYCGTIGYLAPSDAGGVDASFNIAARTVVVDEDEGVAEFGVGAAITNRSEVVTAFEEARLKAKVLVDRRPDSAVLAEFRCENGVVRDVDEKLAMLASSVEYFGYGADKALLAEALRQAVDGVAPTCVITLSVDREGDIRAETAPAPPWNDGSEHSATLVGVVARHPVSSENVYLFHTTSSPRHAEILLREHADADAVIVCNERNELAGALNGNVVVSIDGHWFTPPLGCGTAPTALRGHLITEGRVAERVVLRSQLMTADAVGVLDDIHGWRRVGLVG